MQVLFLDSRPGSDQPEQQRTLAFEVAALTLQMERDFIPAYLGELPEGDEPWPARAVTTLKGLDASTYRAIEIVSDIGVPGAAGYHDNAGGIIFGRSDGNPLTNSHEYLELRGDPFCNLYRRFHAGLWYACETSDAVEEDTYDIEVELFGERRKIPSSNFVLPNWYKEGSDGPWDFLGHLTAAGQIGPGGYAIRQDDSGQVSQVFGRGMNTVRMARKLSNPMGRTRRRIMGGMR